MKTILIPLSVLFLATTLMACSQLTTSPSPSPSTHIPVVADPSLTDTFSVQKSYISANGQDCQKVHSESGIELRCFDGKKWQFVPSINK